MNVIEIGVILAVIVAAWFYLRSNDESDSSTAVSENEPATEQAKTPKAESVQTPAPVIKAAKPVIVVPEDSTLRRHYMQNLTANKQVVETPFPEDSALRRHYQQNLAAQQDNSSTSQDDTKQAAEELVIPASPKTVVPKEAELKRDVIQQLVAETEATLPPRPTDSTLKRHYDTQLMSIVLGKLKLQTAK